MQENNFVVSTNTLRLSLLLMIDFAPTTGFIQILNDTEKKEPLIFLYKLIPVGIKKNYNATDYRYKFFFILILLLFIPTAWASTIFSSQSLGQ